MTTDQQVNRMYVDTAASPAWHRDRDGRYPVLERADGVRIWDADGNEYLDFLSGGAMVTLYGHGDRPQVRAAITAQAAKISYAYGDVATTPVRERLSRAVADLAPAGFTRTWLTSGGSEANEAMMRAVLSYWIGRGQPHRNLIVAGAVSYHGGTFGTLSLPGRPGLRAPYEPYIRVQASIPPCDPRTDPDGQQSLAALDRLLAAGNVAAVLLEPVSGMSYPGYSPPRAFWGGLEERRRDHGFLVCLTRSSPRSAGAAPTSPPPSFRSRPTSSRSGKAAFRAGRSLGVQFHPEADEALVRSWLDHGREEITRLGLDPGDLIGQTRQHEDQATARAGRLVDSFTRQRRPARTYATYGG